jgi:predicted ATPase/DNA-binding winged helix-turn-helix (wHTH) protein
MSLSFTFGPYELFKQQQRLLKDGEPCAVNSRAFQILCVLVEHAGELVGNRKIMDSAWPESVVEISNLRMQIAALRRALGDRVGESRYIVNTPGRGYIFIEPVFRRDMDKPIPTNFPTSKQGFWQQDGLGFVFPRMLVDLIGREGEIQDLSEQLLLQRFITITGAGGIGKTSLVIATVSRIISRYRDGACFVNLASAQASEEIVGAIGAAVGLELTGTVNTADIVHALQCKDVLVVLDNCEHVVDDTAHLVELLLREAPSVRILATSREPIRAEGEHLKRLRSLGFPDTTRSLTSIDELRRYPAIQMFVDRAKARLDSFDISPCNALAVARVCERLEGIPLAIDLVAAMIDQFSPLSLLLKLEGRLSFFSQGRRTAPARHRSLRATIDWSFDMLSDVEKLVFLSLGFFDASFTLKMVEDVNDSSDIETGEIEIIMQKLVIKSLVVAEVGNIQTRYRLPGITRTYVVEKAGDIFGNASLFSKARPDNETRSADLFDAQLKGGGEYSRIRQRLIKRGGCWLS